MWNEKVTIYIDDTSLRLLVTNGQRVKKWADVRLEPGLVKDTIVVQEAEVGARIKTLIKSLKIHTHKVVLGVSGLHSLTRPAYLPILPKSMLTEAVAREARRVLPVPLDQLYLSWTTIPGPKSRTSIYLAATPRKSIDSIIRALKIGGLEVTRMSIKPLALTKVVPLKTAILVDLQPTEFDIIIMVDGVSQPVRSISLPSEELSGEQKIKMILNDLDRTLKFYATNNQEKPLDSKIPIYVSGELVSLPQYRKMMEHACGRTTMAVAPSFRGLERLDPGRYMVNISVALSVAAGNRDATIPIANLNMLPAPYQPKPLSLAKVVGIPGSIAGVAVLVPMLMMMQSTSTNINVMQSQLDTANQIINQKSVQRLQIRKDITDLEKKTASAKLVVDNFNKSLNTIIASQDIVNGDLLLSLGKLCPEIKLRSISESTSHLEITGVAPSGQDIQAFAQSILTYARDLDTSDRFSDSLISSLAVSTASMSEEVISSAIPQQIEFTLTFIREKK